MKRPVFIAAVVLLSTGCTLAPVGSWTYNRGADLTDAAHLRWSYVGEEAVVNVGPVVLGGGTLSDFFGNGDGVREQLGLGCYLDKNEGGTCRGLLYPFSSYSGKCRSRVGYGASRPAWGSMGVDIGYFVTVGARLDAVELLDFVLGLVEIDMLDDDALRERDQSREPGPSAVDAKTQSEIQQSQREDER